MKRPAETPGGELTAQRLGRATWYPQRAVTAGEVGQWTLTLTVGSYGIDEGGTIKVAQRFASDWEVPQFDRPSEQGYTTLRTSGDAKLRARYDRKGHVRPYMRCLVVDVYDGSLAPGDTVTIVFGDQSEGSPGIRAQSFQESAHEILVCVDPTNACLVRELPDSPVFPIVPGPPQSVFCVVPSDGSVGEVVPVFCHGRDQWGNPCSLDAEKLDAPVWQGTTDVAVVQGDGRLRLQRPGTGCVVVAYAGELYRSNPIMIHDPAQDAPNARPLRRHYWGDLHAQTDATVGTGTEEEYFRFGRDEARLDFISHQGNDFQMTDDDWERLNRVTRQFHVDHRYVVFPGYEWSANTPAGGDRNVFFRREGYPIIRSSHWQIPETVEDQRTPAHPANVFFERIRQHVPLDDVLVASHVGGRYADIRRYLDAELAPLVEVVSCWGVFEWMLFDAFEREARVGVMCNSDGHKGRPGDEGPGAGEFGIASGLTCVLADELTRDAVFDALKQRRCYGTSGPRILLDVEVDGAAMGAEIQSTGEVNVAATTVGVAGIDSLELFAGRERLDQVRPPAFENLAGSRRLRIMWGGSRIRGRGRRAHWDGTLHIEGNSIEAVELVSFDSPADGIVSRSDREIQFRSRTTGDLDGLDLILKQAQTGRIAWETPLGTLEADLGQLGDGRVSRSFGGLDLRCYVEWYPDDLGAVPTALAGQWTVRLNQPWTPLWLKVTQVDGHMAWSSPVYVKCDG